MDQPAQPKPKHPKLLGFIAVAMLTLIVLAGLAVLIAWLILKPKHLVYSVEDAAIHNFNLTDVDHLYANFDFTLRAYNPNSRVSIYYDSLEISVQYEEQTIATNAVVPFFQPHNNETWLHVRLTAQTVALYGSVPKDLHLEKSSGDVELNVWVGARIRYKVGIWKSRDRTKNILFACFGSLY